MGGWCKWDATHSILLLTNNSVCQLGAPPLVTCANCLASVVPYVGGSLPDVQLHLHSGRMLAKGVSYLWMYHRMHHMLHSTLIISIHALCIVLLQHAPCVAILHILTHHSENSCHVPQGSLEASAYRTSSKAAMHMKDKKVIPRCTVLSEQCLELASLHFGWQFWLQKRCWASLMTGTLQVSHGKADQGETRSQSNLALTIQLCHGHIPFQLLKVQMLCL